MVASQRMVAPDLACNQANVIAATGLMVKASTIAGAGLGLFAERAFAEGEVVCVYTGILLTRNEVIELGSHGDDWPDRLQFVMGFPEHEVCIDSPPGGLPSRFINDNDDRSRLNVRFVKRERLLLAEVVALRDLAPGEELFADYGPEFWTGQRARR